MNPSGYVKRSRWLALRNAKADPRWKSAVAIKLRLSPICQVRVRCNGAEATDAAPISWSTNGGSFLDPRVLQSTCPACYQWKLAGAMLRVHP